jgi:cardiolipin synthase
MQRFDVTFLGKSATLALMFSMPAFMLGGSELASAPIFQAIGWAFGAPGLVLSYYTALRYVPTLRTNLRAGRHARSERRERAA